MAETPLLTLAIPVAGDVHCEPLRRTLEGVHRALEEQDIELLVQVSEPESPRIQSLLQGHPTAPSGEYREDRGIYDAMNRLIERAKGARILFLGAGDVPLTGLGRALDRWTAVDDTLELGGVRIPNAEPGVPRHYAPRWDRGLRWRNVAHHQGIAYPLQLIRTFGGFPLEFPVLGDYALNIELWQEGVKARWSLGEDWVSAAPGGVSRRFTPTLYSEELQMKQAILKPGLARSLQPLWIRMKARFKRQRVA